MIAQYIKRPSLLWMSRNDILKVRNKLLGLYIPKEELFSVAMPENSIAKTIGIHIQINLQFVYPWKNIVEMAWLKIPKDKNPYWEVMEGTANGIIIVPFSKKKDLAQLIKKYSKHFPFAPTDNFLQNGGNPIA